MTYTKQILVVLFSAIASIVTSQEVYTLTGSVRGGDGEPLVGASVYATQNNRFGTYADHNGLFTIKFPDKGPWTVKCSMVGYQTEEFAVVFGTEKETQLRAVLKGIINIDQAEVYGYGNKNTTIKRIDPKVASRIPTPRGTVEDVLLQTPVNVTSELSSSYNVRGGSFDENLVYVNDIEVYRPFLTRSGQQEGLSFPSHDMVERIQFSAGGFESKYR